MADFFGERRSVPANRQSDVIIVNCYARFRLVSPLSIWSMCEYRIELVSPKYGCSVFFVQYEYKHYKLFLNCRQRPLRSEQKKMVLLAIIFTTIHIVD